MSVVYYVFYLYFEVYILKEKILNSFIYVGRLDKGKGIEELFDFFLENFEVIFIIVGNGKLEFLVIIYFNRCENIIFKGYILDKNLFKNLFSEY